MTDQEKLEKEKKDKEAREAIVKTIKELGKDSFLEIGKELEFMPKVEATKTAEDIEKEKAAVLKMESIPDSVKEILKSQDDKLKKSEEKVAEFAKTIEKAEAIAKAERDLRLMKESEDYVKNTLSNIPGDQTALAKTLKELAENNPEAAKIMKESLEKSNTAIKESKLFTSIGKSMPSEGSTEAKIDSMAREIMKSDNSLSLAKAKEKVMSENSKLYDEAEKERHERAVR